MKKEYVAPEWETVKLTLTGIIMTSIIEDTIPEVIGGGDDPDPGEISGF